MKLELLTGVLVLAAACSGGGTGAPPAHEGVTHPMTPVTREYVLHDPQRAVGDGPVPPQFDESKRLSDEAHAAYRDKEYARSAELFVEAALALQVPAGEYAGVAAENRRRMLVNAAYAWLTAETPELGRERLTRLREERRASREDVRQALEVLEKP
jgi:hypothetical protein